MAYNYTAEQVAAITRFLTQNQNFLTLFVAQEGAGSSNLNLRLDETQGLLQHLLENTAIVFSEVLPGDPLLATFWVKPSDNTFRIYNKVTEEYVILNGLAVNDLSTREFTQDINTIAYTTLYTLPLLATTTELTNTTLTIINSGAGVGTVRVIYIPNDAILQEESMATGTTIVLNLGNIYNVRLEGLGQLETVLRLTVNTSA